MSARSSSLKADARAQQLLHDSQCWRDMRRGLETAAKADQEREAKLIDELQRTRQKVTDLSEHLRLEELRQFHRLPIQPAQEGDLDLRQELKMLKIERPANRARQLHEAYVAARQDEAEASKVCKQRHAVAQDSELQANALRKQVTQLKEEMQDLQPPELSGHFLNPSAKALPEEEPAPPQSEERQKGPLGKMRGDAATPDSEEEDALLYGVKKRSKTAGLLLARGAPAGLQTSAPAAPMQRTTSATLKTLFAKKR